MRIEINKTDIAVGKIIEAEALYTVWPENCPGTCSAPLGAPIEVSWSTDRPDILGLKLGEKRNPLSKRVSIRGMSAGTASVKAQYAFPSGETLSAEVKITVNDTSALTEKVGTLRISFWSAGGEKIKVGQAVEAKALYTPWSAPCPPDIGCSPPPSVPVAVLWSTDRSDILALKSDSDKFALSNKVLISGVGAGTAYLKAVYYLPSGNKAVYEIKIVVATPITMTSAMQATATTSGTSDSAQ